MARSAAKERRVRRQAKARAMAVDGAGVREIARRLGVDPATISRDLRTEPAQGPPPPPKANTRATKSGATGGVGLAERRAKWKRWAEERWTGIDEHRALLVADLYARTEAASNWVDGQGGGLVDATGRPLGIVDRQHQWGQRLHRTIVELDNEWGERPKSTPTQRSQLRRLSDAQLEQFSEMCDQVDTAPDGTEPEDLWEGDDLVRWVLMLAVVRAGDAGTAEFCSAVDTVRDRLDEDDLAAVVSWLSAPEALAGDALVAEVGWRAIMARVRRLMGDHRAGNPPFGDVPRTVWSNRPRPVRTAVHPAPEARRLPSGPTDLSDGLAGA